MGMGQGAVEIGVFQVTEELERSRVMSRSDEQSGACECGVGWRVWEDCGPHSADAGSCMGRMEQGEHERPRELTGKGVARNSDKK